MMRVLFYHPFQPGSRISSQSGSVLRPRQMFEGFKNQGFETTLINGSILERQRKTKEYLQAQENEEIVAYIESANIPMCLSNAKHWPVSFGDLKNIYSISKRMKCGVFYRDAYWRDATFCKEVGLLKGIVLKFLFFTEYIMLTRLCDAIFVPSMAFSERLPKVGGKARFCPLPPACKEVGGNLFTANKSVLYSGNISTEGAYDIRPFIKMFENLPDEITLTINTTQEAKEKIWPIYKDTLSPKAIQHIRFTHIPYGSSYEQRAERYCCCCCCLRIMDDKSQTKSSMPIKLFDYIGMGLPIIANKNTSYGDFVEENNIGWTISDEEDFKRVMAEVTTQPDSCMAKHEAVMRAQKENTWEARCQEVARELCKK